MRGNTEQGILYEEALQLEDKAKKHQNSGLAGTTQEGVDLEVIRQSQVQKVSDNLTETEKKVDKETGQAYYFSPDQEFDTDEYLEFLKKRDYKIQKQAEQNLNEKKFESHEEFLEALEDEKYRLKYFPVMFVSAPHVPEGASGTYPGEPTPLMYATSVLDKYVRTDTFPAEKSPEILSIQNPDRYSDEFVKNFIEQIKDKKPRVVGISNTSEGHYFAIELARITKQYSPESLVILGGSHEDGTNYEAYFNPSVREKFNLTDENKGTLEKQLTLNKDKERELIDILVAGDGQYALVDILKFIANNSDRTNQEIISEIIKNQKIFNSTEGSGHIFVKDDKNKVNSISLSGNPLDWNNLPFMFRGRLTTENKFPVFGGKKTAQVMTQTICKYACSFCAESLASDKNNQPSLYKICKDRPTPERALKEIEILIKDYGYEAVFFDDSTFTQDKSRTERLLNGIIDLAEKGRSFEWGCQTTFTDIPSKEFIDKMKEAGCSYIYFGFEQLEEEISKGGKKIKLEKVVEVLGWCKSSDIRAGVSLQFGLEGIGDYQQTIDYITDLYKQGLISENSIAININTPYPGTKEWLDLSKKGVLPDFSQQLKRHPRFESANQLSNLTSDTVNEIYVYAREKLGKGLIGIEFDSQEIQQHLERYRQEYNKDFYFDWEYFQEYLDGSKNALNLNHASISNRPGEVKRLLSEAGDMSESERENLFEQARIKAANLVGVNPEAVVFGRNTT
ncbi:MAG TPA: radical SAM protein, partial [Patescibacteria group bacterium]|nr:radical SAM protein [Patescibacteria group bacterium]